MLSTACQLKHARHTGMVCNALARKVQDTGTTLHSSCQGVRAFGVSRQAVSIMELPMHPAASNWHDSCTPLAQRFLPLLKTCSVCACQLADLSDVKLGRTCSEQGNTATLSTCTFLVP